MARSRPRLRSLFIRLKRVCYKGWEAVKRDSEAGFSAQKLVPLAPPVIKSPPLSPFPQSDTSREWMKHDRQPKSCLGEALCWKPSI